MTKILRNIQANYSRTIIANILLFFTMIAWGTSFISTKIAIAEVPPFTIAFIRLAITSCILWPIFRKYEPTTRLDQKGKSLFAITGLLGITIYFCFENIGIKLTTASNASLITSVTPILSITLNMLFFKARLSLCELLGVLLGIGGSYLTITANGALDTTSDNFLGNVFVIGSMISWSFYTIFSKKQQSNNSDLAIVTYQTIFGTLFLIPFAATEYHQWHLFSFSALLQIIYLAVICSAACYFLYIYVLKILDVTLTTIYLNLVPITGIITGYLVLDERILPIQLLGGIMILAAILVANLDKLLKFSRS